LEVSKMKKITISLIVFLLLITFTAYSLDLEDEALVGLWFCDDGDGDTVTDSSGNGNDGVISGAFDWIGGKFGGAILANGGGSINVQNSDSIDSVTDQVTIAAWFRVDADSDTGIRRQNAYLLEDQSASEPVPDGFSFRIWTTDGLSPGIYGSTELEQGEWYHLAGTYDGEIMKLYVNGVPEEELLTSDGGASDGKWGGKVGTPGDQLQLKYASESLTGGMDEICLFSRALSDDEIALLAEGWENALAVNPKDKLPTTWAELKSR
jgi:hypothetical protein